MHHVLTIITLTFTEGHTGLNPLLSSAGAGNRVEKPSLAGLPCGQDGRVQSDNQVPVARHRPSRFNAKVATKPLHSIQQHCTHNGIAHLYVGYG